MRTEHYQQLIRTADSVAAHLGDEWAVDVSDEDHGPELHGPDGARIAMRNPDWEVLTRVHLSGCYPEHGWRSNRVVVDSINVRLTRGPETIAKEIERRLLPGYLPALAKAQEFYAKQADDRACRVNTAEELAARIGGRVDAGRDRDDVARKVYAQVGSTGLVVELFGDGQKATLEVHHGPTWVVRAALAGIADEWARRADTVQLADVA